MDLTQVLNEIITSGIGLGLVAAAYAVHWMAGFVPNLFSPKTWKWKRGLEDLTKALLMGFVLIAGIGLLNVGAQFFAILGFDITEAVGDVSTYTMVSAMAFGFGYYISKAIKNASAFFKLSSEVSGDKEAFERGVGQVGDWARETITKLYAKKDIEESVPADSPLLESTDITERELADAGKGGITNTYPEPYRSAAQDSLVDPSSCYNREAQPAGTLITLEDGTYKAVEDIQVGDKLWNHDGTEIVTVKSLWKEKKPVYTVRTGLGDIRFTGEHPLYTRRNKWKALARGKLSAFADPQFVKTKDLKVGDKVFVPELDGQALPLTDNELRWLGFYLGDGTKSLKSPKCPMYRLIVPDGRKRKYVDSLGLAGSYSVHSHTKKAKFFTLAKKQSPELRKILDELDSKSFSRLVVPEQAKLIVEGYLAADGCHIYGDVYSASSTDKRLLLAIQRMVLSIGGTMSIHKRYDEGELEKFGTTVYAKTLWDASINLRPKRSQIHSFKDGKYATISKIELGEEDEEVYNIEVSGSHTYIADNHGVHNCVSYCAWKIYELTGRWLTRTGSMNAKEWVARLRENGYGMVVSAPQNGGKYVGISTAGQYGHAIWFEEGSTISEYNYVARGTFSVRQINLGAYIWVQIQAPGASNNGGAIKKSNQEIADEVIAGKWGDKNSNPTREEQLTAAGYDYNAIQTIVNAKVAPTTPPKETAQSKKFAVGDIVRPTKLVDYSGRALRQYDSSYTITQLIGNRAVLSSRGAVWAALNTANIEKV